MNKKLSTQAVLLHDVMSSLTALSFIIDSAQSQGQPSLDIVKMRDYVDKAIVSAQKMREELT